ncbi:ABC transporter permease [Clostridioides difficile]
MKMLAFASRNTKEILRDPINLFFGIAFPIVIMLLLSAIQANIPVEIFEIDTLAPGIAVFGLSFISLFSGTLIAKDRSTSFLVRLFSSPLKASDFILGYTLPLIIMAIIQSLICFIAASFLGLTININTLVAIITLIPTIILYIGIGLLSGSLFTDKQVGGICGALLTNLTAWLSGTWFDLKLVGGAFKTISYLLPFVYAVNATRAAISGDYSKIMQELWVVILYAIIIFSLAIFVFNKKMKSDNM